MLPKGLSEIRTHNPMLTKAAILPLYQLDNQRLENVTEHQVKMGNEIFIKSCHI